MGERGVIEARVPTTDYNIDLPIVKWIKKPNTQTMMKRACGTRGGWEPWAQLELEEAFMNAFGFSEDIDIREEPDVFNNGKIADFVLPETAQFKGMIIELKCENKITQKGNLIKTPVDKDIAKQYDVKSKYSHYTFVALAMAFTTEAQTALTKIGMAAIPQATCAVPGQGTMKVYKEKIRLAQLTKDMDDLSKALEGLFKSDPAKKPAGKTPAGKKTTGSA